MIKHGYRDIVCNKIIKMFHSSPGYASLREKNICMNQKMTKDGKIRLLQRFLVLILLICLAGVLVSCRHTKSPEAVTEAFFDAVKKKNTEAALRCFTPELRAQYRTALKISAKLLSVETGEILSSLAGISDPVNAADTIYEIVDVYQTDQTHAEVQVRIQNGEKKSIEAALSCIRIGQKWFLFR